MTPTTPEPNKTALVTGGTRGIGLGIARALAAEGWAIAVNGLRSEDEAAPVLESLRPASPHVVYCRGNVAEHRDRAAILAQVRHDFGRLDLLVNNAGIAPRVRADILEATEESFDDIMAVNLKGPYFLTQLAAKWMVEQRAADPAYRGMIVNIGSVSAELASVNRGDYCLSRAGTSMATKLWAVRLAEHGVSVFEIRPGIIATDMTGGVSEHYDALIAGGLTLERRWGQPEDVGQAVAMLARGDLAYGTGQAIHIDGGMTVGRL